MVGADVVPFVAVVVVCDAVVRFVVPVVMLRFGIFFDKGSIVVVVFKDVLHGVAFVVSASVLVSFVAVVVVKTVVSLEVVDVEDVLGVVNGVEVVDVCGVVADEDVEIVGVVMEICNISVV